MILGDWPSSPCRRHREVLVDFVDRGAGSEPTGAALAHLDTCRRCREELSETLQAITALRRMAAETNVTRPSDDVWTRIRMRIDRPRAPAWVARVSMGSLVVASAVAAMLLAPVTWTPSGGGLEEVGTDLGAMRSQADQIRVSEARTELRFTNTRLPGPSGPGVWRGIAPKVDPNTSREADMPGLAVQMPAIRAE